MTIIVNNGLSAPQRAVIMRAAVASAALLLLCSFATIAAAQEQPQGKRDDLDVTMQIIVDPDAKLPDEVVRRIPLPARKPAETSSAAAGGQSGNSDAGPEKDRDNAASEQGKETSEAAQERAREAQEQREAARRAAAEEKNKRERGPPDRPDPPNPPRN